MQYYKSCLFRAIMYLRTYSKKQVHSVCSEKYSIARLPYRLQSMFIEIFSSPWVLFLSTSAQTYYSRFRLNNIYFSDNRNGSKYKFEYNEYDLVHT